MASQADSDAGLNRIITTNIRSLVETRERLDAQRTLGERIADRVTAFLGSMVSVVLHAVVFVTWVVVNTGVVPFIEPVDPFPFVGLAMWASAEAIFLTSFVLISQNRAARTSERQAQLDLHVGLLAEHEITRLVHMTDRLLAHHGLEPPREELEEIKRDVRPEKVLERIAEEDPT